MKGSTYLRVTALILALLAPLARAEVAVVASIKPLQMIAAAVMEGAGEPDLLIQGQTDPHHHALRPSERQLLARAELMLWVGPALEGFLPRLVEELDAHSLAASEIPGLTLLDNQGAPDPHVWLSSANARLIARALSARLADTDPANAALYQRNLSRFEQNLEEAEARIEALLGEVSAHQPYAVYHDAFRYFTEPRGLSPLLSFTRDEELKPGLRQLLAIREQLRAEGVGCILVQPGVDSQALANVVDMPEMRYISLDVLGSDLPAEADGYPRLLESVARALRDCLQATP